MSKKLELKAYSVSEELFEEILTFGYRVKITESKDEFDSYKYGYNDKALIIYNGYSQMIVLECVLNDHFNLNMRLTHWKQCIVTKDPGQSSACEKTITGGMAKKVMESKILQYYSREEYEERLNMFQAPHSDHLKQYHFELKEKQFEIKKYTNCYKYDINGAHNAALKIIFPKAAHVFEQMYQERKIKPINKQFINFYVGMLTYGHRRTYNWIVQRVTTQLLAGINHCMQDDGLLLYANTDGFLIKDPGQLLEHSTALGDFKLEYHGDAYIYFDENYWCYQTHNEIKGSILYAARKHLDLKAGKVVHYDKVKVPKADIYVAENIVEEILREEL